MTAPPGKAATIEVQVIGDKPDALQKIPGSGTLITSQQIQRAEPLDVAEMLRRVPGLQVRQGQEGGVRLDVGVRGLDATRSRRVLVLEDGIPIANNPYGEPDLYYGPPIERLRGIEVVKGSGSILFGPQTIGGVVNFLTILPPERREITLDVRGGNGGYLRLLGRYGDAVGSTRYVAQVLYRRGDGAREQPFYATNALAKISFPTSSQGEATFKIGVHDEVASSSDVGLTSSMFELDPFRPTIAPADEVRLRRYEASLSHEHTFSESTALRTLLYAFTTSRLWRRQDYDRIPQPGVRYSRVVGDTSVPYGAIFFRATNTVRDRSYEVFGIEPRIEHRASTWTVRHTLEAGARLLVETAHREQRAGASSTTYAGASVSDESSQTLALSAHVQDRIALRDDLLVTPGVRIEHVRSSRAILRAVVAGTPSDVSIQGASVLTSVIPGIGMVLGTPGAHAFGGLHLGFAPPRVTSAIDAGGIDEELEAERSLNYEAGARFTPRRWLRAEATGFLSNFSNQIIPSNRAGSATTDLVNGGRTRHLGAEGALSLRLGEALALGVALDLAGTYTLIHATFVDGPRGGEVLPYAPLHTATATLNIEHTTGVGAEVAYAYVGSQLADDRGTIEADPSGRIGQIEGHHELDMTLRYRHARTGLSGSLAVKNVPGVAYIASRRPDGIFPAGQREILLGVRWDYR